MHAEKEGCGAAEPAREEEDGDMPREATRGVDGRLTVDRVDV